MSPAPAVPARSGARRQLAATGAILALACVSGCTSDTPASGTAAQTAAADTTSGPAGPKAASAAGPAASRGAGTRSAAHSVDARAEIAGATVSRFYAAYLASPGKETASGYLTPALLDEIFSAQRDYDRVVCSHALPDAMSATPGTVKGKNASVSVTGTQQGVKLPAIRVTVRIADQRIVGIACPT